MEPGSSFPVTGRRGLLVWARELRETPSDSYRLDPPAPAEASGLFLVAPESLETFSRLLVSDRAAAEDWLRFLSCCRLVEGSLSDSGTLLTAWREQPLLPALERAHTEMEAKEVRPGTGPALLPIPGGRIPLNEDFLAAIRQNREFFGRAGEGVGRGTLHAWAVPFEGHLEVLLAFHHRPEGGPFQVLFHTCRIPAGRGARA